MNTTSFPELLSLLPASLLTTLLHLKVLGMVVAVFESTLNDGGMLGSLRKSVGQLMLLRMGMRQGRKTGSQQSCRDGVNLDHGISRSSFKREWW